MTAFENGTKAKRPPRIALTARDHRLMSLVARFRLLSRNQVMALTPFGSVTRVNMRLASLVRAGLLARKYLPVYPGHGSAQSLYYPGRRSAEILPSDPRVLAAQIRQISRWELRQVDHVLAANQVLAEFIAALTRASEDRLLAFCTEPELRRALLDRPFVPDGWVSWSRGGRRFNCFTEVDLHHEGLIEWRQKVLAYLDYAESSLHQERFGFRSFRVLVLANSRPRIEHLRQVACEAGRLFLFASLEKIGRQNLLSPMWQCATGVELVALSDA